MVHISAPGKLFISGEWAILKKGNKGLVAAVNKRVHSIVKESEQITITIDDFSIKNLPAKFIDNKLIFDYEDKEKLSFLKGSIETALCYIKEQGTPIKKFSIHTWGDLSQIGDKKIGFGSSAASVVAVIAAVLKFHGIKFTKDQLYKLSTIAHYFVQGKVGSAFDVAASTFGGLFVYSRFDAKWLVSQIESRKQIKEILNDKWPGFYIEELEIPSDFNLLIGWTGSSASTSAMVKQLNAWAEKNKEEYDALFQEINDTAKNVIDTIKTDDKEQFKENIQKNEALLRELGEKSGVNIETQELKKLADIAYENGGCGKLSGAGGGDCGIGICFSKDDANKIKHEWKKSGLKVVDATIDKEGFKYED